MRAAQQQLRIATHRVAASGEVNIVGQDRDVAAVAGADEAAVVAEDRAARCEQHIN